MAKRKSKYNASQRKAYYMGYGAGIVERNSNIASREFSTMVDESFGQRNDLCSSAKAGYWAAKKENKAAPPFSIGYKRYPVTDKVWFNSVSKRNKSK